MASNAVGGSYSAAAADDTDEENDDDQEEEEAEEASQVANGGEAVPSTMRQMRTPERAACATSGCHSSQAAPARHDSTSS